MDVATLIAQADKTTWSAWQTIVLNTLPQFSTQECEQLISELLQLGDTDSQKHPSFHLLAMACLDAVNSLPHTSGGTSSSVSQLSPALVHVVEKRLSKLVPPHNAKAAQVLANVGTLAVKPLEYQLLSCVLSKRTRFACLQALVLINTDDALNVLSDYVQTAAQPDGDACLKLWSIAIDPEQYVERVLVPLFLREGRTQLTICQEKGREWWGEVQLKSLRGLQYLTMLKNLVMNRCEHLNDISPLATLTELEELTLENCKKLTSVAPLAHLTKLRTLNLTNCKRLHNLVGLSDKPALKALEAANCERLENLSPLTSLPSLEWLDLRHCKKLHDISSLAHLTQLQTLKLDSCTALHDISSLAHLTQLQDLSLWYLDQVQDINCLAHLAQLEWLGLDGSSLHDASSLSSLRNLISLRLTGSAPKLNLACLTHLPRLEFLYFYGSYSLPALPASLRDLYIEGSGDDMYAPDLMRLTNHPNLRKLEIWRGHGLTDLIGLADLPQLSELTLGQSTGLTSLQGLANLPSLQKISVSECPALRDIEPVSHLESLPNLDFVK